MTQHTFSSLLQLLVIQYVGVLLAVLADLVSGLRKARRNGDPIISGRLRRTVSKLSSYYLALFCLTIVDALAVTALLTLAELGRPFLPAFPYLTTVGSLSLALIEAKSIAENSPHRTSFLTALQLLVSLIGKRSKSSI